MLKDSHLGHTIARIAAAIDGLTARRPSVFYLPAVRPGISPSLLFAFLRKNRKAITLWRERYAPGRKREDKNSNIECSLLRGVVRFILLDRYETESSPRRF